MTQEIVVPVSSLVLKIKNVLNQNINLSNVWIQGEISNLTKHRSGHYYFSIKDQYSEMSCIMFSSYVRQLNFELKEGMKVCLTGTINVYEQRGSLQINVKYIKEDGIGALYQELEQRKQRLYQQGYFDPSHKKDKPEWIENIGIITAKQGAALQDVLKTISLRFPAMKVTLYPAYVQGNNAPSSIIQALLKADEKNHDALLLVRGGGSFEDLFCFNDEQLVKTIYNLNTFIVSGIGHETDTTLTDLVSDYRALTPTAAAQYVSVDTKDLRKHWKQTRNELIKNINHLFTLNKSQFLSIKNQPYLIDPHSYITDLIIQLDSYEYAFSKFKQNIDIEQINIQHKKDSLQSKLKEYLEQCKLKKNQVNLEEAIINYKQTNQQAFANIISLLNAYSPLNILERGYSLTKKDSTIIRSINQVECGDELEILLHKGKITTKVVKKEE